MNSEYLILLGLIIVFPLILSFSPRLGMYRHPRAFFFSLLGMSAPFWAWDIVATARGHWWFNDSTISGVRLLGLPLEEWLFFPVVGFASVFTWEAVKYLWMRRKGR